MPTTTWAPCLQGIDLWAIAYAAVDGDGAQARVAEDDLRLVPDLAGELAGGYQDQGLAAVLLGIQPLDHGEQEGAGLAGAGARLDHHVAAGQQVRNGAGLDGHQGRPAGALDGSTQRLGKLLNGYVR